MNRFEKICIIIASVCFAIHSLIFWAPKLSADYYDGANWSTANCYYYTGAAWAPCSPYRYTGAAWGLAGCLYEATETTCDDSCDNDRDGDVDGADSDCGGGGADETFDTNPGYDLTWTAQTGSVAVDPDSTTYAVSGQSLCVNNVLDAFENYTVFDRGSTTASWGPITWSFYADTVTLPAAGDYYYVAAVSSAATAASQTTGVVIQVRNLSGSIYMNGRGATYGTDIPIVMDSWVTVSIDYVQNGTTTILINGSDSSVTTPDVAAQYFHAGAIFGLDADESFVGCFDNVDGLQ